ncbi:MAG: hypothetical protein ACOH2V_12885 [Candidatus Saccharimonadaceae bacterium]
MRFIDLFVNKNSKELSQAEKETPEILYDIFRGSIVGEPAFMSGRIDKLSVDLYYLAFNRTNRKSVKLEVLEHPTAFLINSRDMQYVEVYSFIKECVTEMCNDPMVSPGLISLKDCEYSILYLLQLAANKIREI